MNETTELTHRQTIVSIAVYHPWKVLILFSVIILLLAGGLGKLSFSNDIRVFFDHDNPELLAYERFEDTYSKTNSVLFVVEPADQVIFTQSTLRSILKLTEKAWHLPYVRRVDSITNFQYSRAEEDDLIVEDLIYDADELSVSELDELKRVALNEPLLLNRLISPDAKVTAVNVIIALPGDNPVTETPEVAQAARKLAAEVMQSNPSIQIHLTGLVMINNALGEEGEKDVATLIPVMLLLVFLLIWLVFRSIAATIVTLIVFIFAVIGAHGVAGWFEIRLSPPTLSAANIILTLAVADCIHILTNYFQLQQGSRGKRDAMAESLRINYWPVMLTSLTTAIGFLTMLGSESPPFRDLGVIVAAGIILAWIGSLFLLPSLLVLIPHNHGSGLQFGFEKFMERIAHVVIRHQRILFWSIGAITLALTLFVAKNQINDEFVRYFDEETSFRKATEFSIDRLTGFEFIEYSIDSGESGGINNPEYLRLVDDFAHWYRQQSQVRHVFSYADIIKRINKNMNQDNPLAYRLPLSREMAAQYLLLYEMSLPQGLDLGDQINIDKSATRLRVSLNHITTKQMLELERNADAWFRENALPKFTTTATGQSLMFAHIGQRNTIGLLATTTIALLLISVILIVAFRSWRFGLLSLLPNLAPVGMAFGFWGLFIGQVGLALSVVVGMTMGIIIDDTVHFLSKYLRARREQRLSPEQAIVTTFKSVGSAIWITSLVLIIGFAVLVLSKFELNSSMGILSAITISMALIADFLLLPSLLLRIDNNKNHQDT